jgi:hypothetical protein
MSYLGRQEEKAAGNSAITSDVAAIDESFRENAPMTAAEAAAQILDGVRAGEWRILVGKDAEVLDAAVRATPLEAYEPDFYQRMREQGVFSTMPEPPAGSN